MRDDSTEGMVELIGASKIAPFVYACEVIAKISSEALQLRFAVDEQAYMLLKKILSFQPFEPGSYSIYRYYFIGKYQKEDQHGRLICRYRLTRMVDTRPFLKNQRNR